MTISYFAFFEAPDATHISSKDLAHPAAVLSGLPRLIKALIFTPPQTITEHFFMDDPPSPTFGFQLHFSKIEDLEDVLRRDGPLQALARPVALPSLRDARVSQQAMIARAFPVDDPRLQTETGALPCSYLVHYPGAARDLNAWHAYYLDHHPQIMRTFPGIRAIEIYTRLDWCSFMPWERVDYMQRNKLVFDHPAALSHAMRSPTMAKMRADYAQFPEFTGGNIHYPVLTRELAVGAPARLSLQAS